jgi:hypothetical protein
LDVIPNARKARVRNLLLLADSSLVGKQQFPRRVFDSVRNDITIFANVKIRYYRAAAFARF